MSAIDLLGKTLRKPNGESVSTADALKGKEVLGLYFSAHWCPPCKAFTPKLSERYTKLLEAKKSIEIVFVSSDHDEKAFTDYHNSMSFLAIPYSDRDAEKSLSKKFKVRGIPTLVFVDAQTGALITNEGREAISEDDYLEAFPFKPVPLDVVATLGGDLRKPDGSTISVTSALEGKSVLALYFSAHWCPPCRGFTPQLVEKYNALQKAGKPFEMVFVSSDQDENAFEEYHNSMSFLGLPYAQRAAKNKLSKYFKVEGIPTLVFYDLDSKTTITTSGRGSISSESFIEDFPYHPKPCYDISESLDGINEELCLIWIMDKADKDSKDRLSKELYAFAEGEKKKPESEALAGRFFTAKGGGPLEQIKSKCGYADAGSTPVALLLNLDDEGAYYHPPKDLAEPTIKNIEAFLKAFKAGKLERRQFGQ